MAQKNKHNGNNDGSQNSEGAKIDDFVAPQKVSAFVRSYEPADKQTFTTEVFNEARLREYFKADVCPCGDPLVVYLEMLENAGFNMVTSIQGEPVILAKAKY